MQNQDSNSRRNFLKKIPLALGSVIFLSGFKSEKTNNNIVEQKYKTLSDYEMNNIIRNEKFPVELFLNPSPAPREK